MRHGSTLSSASPARFDEARVLGIWGMRKGGSTAGKESRMIGEMREGGSEREVLGGKVLSESTGV